MLYGVSSMSLQKLINYPSLRTNLTVVWINYIVMKNCCQQQDKSYCDCLETCQLPHCANVPKVAVRTNQIVFYFSELK